MTPDSLAPEPYTFCRPPRVTRATVAAKVREGIAASAPHGITNQTGTVWIMEGTWPAVLEPLLAYLEKAGVEVSR